MTPRKKSAGAIIYRRSREDLRFLLLHYPAGHWDFAKGKMEPGETMRQTAIRETWEETGIRDLRFINGFEHHIRYEFQYNGRTVHKQVIFFLAETTTKRVSLSHEHVGYTWTGLDGALERITFANSRNALLRAHRHMCEPGSPEP